MSDQTTNVKNPDKEHVGGMLNEACWNLFYPVALLLLCLFLVYFITYEGKYKFEYFLADSHSEMTELASKYHKLLSEDADYEIQYILYLPQSWLSHRHKASIQFAYEGKTLEIEYRDEGLLPGFHAWIDLEDPESIRFYNEYLQDDRYYLSKEAEAVKDSIERAHKAVRTYIENKDSWNQIFHSVSNREDF